MLNGVSPLTIIFHCYEALPITPKTLSSFGASGGLLGQTVSRERLCPKGGRGRSETCPSHLTLSLRNFYGSIPHTPLLVQVLQHEPLYV